MAKMTTTIEGLATEVRAGNSKTSSSLERNRLEPRDEKGQEDRKGGRVRDSQGGEQRAREDSQDSRNPKEVRNRNDIRGRQQDSKKNLETDATLAMGKGPTKITVIEMRVGILEEEMIEEIKGGESTPKT
jgi:hypothetical protein